MNSNPLFSILIASYNNGQYIEETLDSIYKQTYTNWEIIIVDDGSNDNSHNIYKVLEANPKIKIYYNNINEGTGYTKRKCAELAKGDICGFVDPDDTITTNALALMVEEHLKYEKASLIHSRYIICDELLNVIGKTFHHKQTSLNDPFFFNLEHIIGHFASFKRNFYNETEGISVYQKKAIDQDLYLKLYEVGECVFLDEYLYNYRIHEGGISTTGNVTKANYWHWVAIIEASRRRKVNIENLFVDNFVLKSTFDNLNNKYLRVKKYEGINTIFNKIKNLFK